MYDFSSCTINYEITLLQYLVKENNGHIYKQTNEQTGITNDNAT